MDKAGATTFSKGHIIIIMTCNLLELLIVVRGKQVLFTNNCFEFVRLPLYQVWCVCQCSLV